MEFMATKGIEYLIAISYLLLLVPFFRLLAPEPGAGTARAVKQALAPVLAMRAWFSVPDGLLFHRGHTWAEEEGGGVYRIGIDDFAQRLVGRADAVDLPPPGASVEAGAPAFRLHFGAQAVDVLSPVGGDVVAANPAAQADTGLVCADPYGAGWLFKVRARRPSAPRSNLLGGRTARAWMDEAAESLSALMGPKLGPVLQDGGVPVSGFARELSPGDWTRIAGKLLLTE